ncbi:antibiotic biosynthesis monooxygenase [Rhodococcus sp. SBT000017]|uniref:putative quinol monooxygenase n=1 Tax=unclassified Rhodococcus (in: high G+C Gram-positive bacteria) TaxID=192944 RepID=UPI000A72543D|nr:MULTISPECIES: antibiotic biosynthesis monooxygenase [unclassified Rhodococcus (in: high G+C Gram-positive bacteria)]RMB77711.1 antibiotic biosynthesis monooxygenase [Rhodococcus sp. SBT000017]
MALIALLDLTFKPESVADARALLRTVLADTRAFEGCLGVEVWVDEENEAHMIAYETWESAEADAKYREFRAGPGKIAELPPLLAAPPTLTKFTTDSSF